MRWSCLMVVLFGIGSASTIAVGSGPADDLFRLVPADSGVTLAVEDLRDHSRVIGESGLFQGLSRLPTVRAWLASDRFRMIERTSKEIKAGLGLSLEVIRDDLLGDAVILSLQPGPATQPDLAQGLLLVRPRDRDLIPRLLKSLNEIQTRGGELDRVETRSRGTQSYLVRQFKAGQRPPEFIIQLEDGTFAWSNSESMIHGVIDRKGGIGSGLGDDPRFRKVRNGLPERALISLFINPRLLERLVLDPARPSKTSPDPIASLLGRYLGAVAQLGFAIQWRDGIVIHSHEVIEPDKLEAWLKRWLTRPAGPEVSLASIPSTATAVVSANLDFEAIAEATRQMIPEADRASFANLKIAAQGILLGHDPITWLLPRLKPNVLAYLEVDPNPEARPAFPWVAVVGWQGRAGDDELAGPVGNAVRTLFAMIAVDPKYREAHLKVESQAGGEDHLTTLANDSRTILAYRSDHEQMILGNSSQAVARFATGPAQKSSLDEIRSKYVPNGETFAIVDVERLVAEFKRIQGPIARKLAARSHRPVAETEGDLKQLVDLAVLFRAFTFSIVTSKDATEIHRSIGLIAR